jgi:hypothetical protein
VGFAAEVRGPKSAALKGVSLLKDESDTDDIDV